MRLGRRGGGDDEAAQRAAQSLAAIEAGGLPLAAQERLANLRAAGTGFYTSDLSTNEFLLVRQAGFRPVSQVMGSCFYTVGWQAMPGMYGGGYGSGYGAFGGYGTSTGQLFELDTEIEAWREARSLAIGRLAEEARLAGADAVVGVRLTRRAHDWSGGTIEFVAVGTAVRSERYDLGDEPVLSNLSGQDFAKLYANGYWPVGLVADTTVVYVMTGWQQQIGSSMFAPNQELRDFTDGIQHTRRLAVSRAARQAHEVHAAGMVGVTLDMSQREYERDSGNGKFRDMIVTVHALGTAIVELATKDEQPPIYIGLDMNEGSA